MSNTILLFSDDLMTVSRVREATRTMGWSLETATNLNGLSGPTPRKDALSAILVSLSLRRTDPFGLIQSIKQSSALAGVPLLAFAGHIETEKHAAARDAGADLVAANSSVAQHLPKLLERLLAADRVGGELIDHEPEA